MNIPMAAPHSTAGSTSTTELTDLQALIRPVLPDCLPQTYELLARTALLRTVRSAETAFRQGEPIPLTLMARGHGAFRRTTVDGKQVTVGIASPGDLFGYSSIASVHSSVDLVALTDCQVALWKGPEIRRVAATDSGFALDVIDRMAGFLIMLTGTADRFVHQDARRRVARVLATHRDLFFGEPAIVSRSHLPGLVGTSREMTGRVLRELENEGTVARVGRTGLKLLRPDLLDAGAAPLYADAAPLSREAP